MEKFYLLDDDDPIDIRHDNVFKARGGAEGTELAEDGVIFVYGA